MTEEEAGKAWRPMTAMLPPNDQKKRTCEGSACVWWRWVPVLPVLVEGNQFRMKYPEPPPTEGYCGPAGRP